MSQILWQVVEIVEPYWSTKFEKTSHAKKDTSPLYPTVLLFESWLIGWMRQLAPHVGGSQSMLFRACTWVAAVKQTSTAFVQFLLPYVVQNVLQHGTGQQELIILELKTVLESNSRGTSRGLTSRRHFDDIVALPARVNRYQW